MAAASRQDLTRFHPYEYTQLAGPSPIRLLKRTGRTSDGILQFSLETRSLDDPNLKYHCLSYTWGNPFAHGVPFREHFDSVSEEYSSAQDHASWPVLIDGQLMRVHRNLHEALQQLPHNVFRDFLDRRTSERGRTVVHGGAAAGLDAFLRLAASRGGDINALDVDGRTPLHRAAARGHVSCTEVLCDAGARRSATDKDGKTARDLATEEGHREVVAALDRWADKPDPSPSIIKPEIDGPQELLWVDAICINQADVEDKNSQVSTMDRIYSQAAYVVAWLGSEDARTEAGLQALATLMAHREEFGKSAIIPYDGGDQQHYKEVEMPLVTGEQWHGLASIFQRQWFRRAWIVQEAVLPSTLIMYCGKHCLSLDELKAVAKSIREVETRLNSRESSNYVPSDEPAVSVEWNLAMVMSWRDNLDQAHRAREHETRQRFRKQFKLSHLITSYWTFLASDVRDKVFALNGLINVFAEEKIKADYRLSVSTVFAAATRQIIREDGDLRILLTRIAVGERRAGLPSWVPDFGFSVSNAIPATFKAAAGLEYRVPSLSPVDSPRLRVQGIRLGKVAQHSTQTDRSPSRKFFLDPSWFKMVLALRGSDKGKEKQRILSDILWRTLCMNMTATHFTNSGIGSDAGPPEDFGVEFMGLVLLLLLAGGDQKLLEAVGLEAGHQREPHTIIHGPKDAMKEYLAETLDDIDAISEHDGIENTVMPRREYVEQMWNSPIFTVVRTASTRRDDEPIDYYPTPELESGASKLVGKGFVNISCRSFNRCRGFAIAYDTACGGRQLFTLDDKYLGLAPLTARVGDEVWVIPGLSAPAVLRRAPDGEGGSIVCGLEDLSIEDDVAQYEFIGGAYVHELMNGEAAEIWGTELQDIDLI